MNDKVTIRINLRQAEVEIHGPSGYMEEVQPTLWSLVKGLKEHMPVMQELLPTHSYPLHTSLKADPLSSQLKNEHSEVYEQPPINQGFSKSDQYSLNEGADSIAKLSTKVVGDNFQEKLFAEIVNNQAYKVSNVDRVLLGAYVYLENSGVEFFKTKNLTDFFKKLQADISNMSHFVKLNLEQNRFAKNKYGYFLTQHGENHLNYSLGLIIEQAYKKITSDDE